MDRSHVDLSYEGALDIRHELVNAACVQLIQAIQKLDGEQMCDALEGEIAVMEDKLIRLGKEKARLYGLLHDYRLKLSGTE
jgi:hypothetical protein